MLDLGWPVHLFPVTPDATGRAELSIPVPAGLVGADLGVQAVGLPPGAALFSATLARPAIL